MRKKREPNIEVHRKYVPDMERMVQALRIVRDYNPKDSKDATRIETSEKTG
ncbi:hypothetical protein [Robertmurraya sp.]|uniref:hypothetical protein n=1 Tax=Robertmurraya sp. TaxID=2837525 RepID=UPI003704243A